MLLAAVVLLVLAIVAPPTAAKPPSVGPVYRLACEGMGGPFWVEPTRGGRAGFVSGAAPFTTLPLILTSFEGTFTPYVDGVAGAPEPSAFWFNPPGLDAAGLIVSCDLHGPVVYGTDTVDIAWANDVGEIDGDAGFFFPGSQG